MDGFMPPEKVRSNQDIIFDQIDITGLRVVCAPVSIQTVLAVAVVVMWLLFEKLDVKWAGESTDYFLLPLVDHLETILVVPPGVLTDPKFFLARRAFGVRQVLKA